MLIMFTRLRTIFFPNTNQNSNLPPTALSSQNTPSSSQLKTVSRFGSVRQQINIWGSRPSKGLNNKVKKLVLAFTHK